MSDAVDTNPTAPTWDAAYHEQMIEQVWLILPTIIHITFFPLMAIATVPGELRMYARIFRRRRVNVHEGLFVVLKYLFVAATISYIVVVFAGPEWPTAQRCFATYWFVKWASFSCGTLLTITMALRTYVVMEYKRWVGTTLSIGLLLHYGAAMMLSVRELNSDSIYGGHCLKSGEGDATDEAEWMTYLAYSVLFDLAMACMSCHKLIRAAGGLKNMHNTTAMLFRHNIHYLLAVTSINLAQLIAGATKAPLPYTLFAAISIQVVLALKQIISEQDSVNGYVAFKCEPLWVKVGTKQKERQASAHPAENEGNYDSESILLRQRGGVGAFDREMDV